MEETRQNKRDKYQENTECAQPFSGTARSVVDEMPEPTPGPSQVLVKSLACGICVPICTRASTPSHGELAKFLRAAKPMDLSATSCSRHEFCCEVLDYGPGVQRKFKPGTHVCSLPVLLTPAGGIQ